MKKVYLYDRGYFWTGEYWTNVIQFAKKYTFSEALDIKLKRFEKTKPRLKIQACADFEKKKNKKESEKKYG